MRPGTVSQTGTVPLMRTFAAIAGVILLGLAAWCAVLAVMTATTRLHVDGVTAAFVGLASIPLAAIAAVAVAAAVTGTAKRCC